MVDLTRNFLTSGPAGNTGGGMSGDDISTGRAYNVVFREIGNAIEDATNKNDSHSKDIINELKALRAQLKADAEKYSTTRLGSTPPDVYREFVDALKNIKVILERGGTAPPAGQAPASGHGEARRVHHHRAEGGHRGQGIAGQAFEGGGLIGGAALVGADALVPGLGIVVKAIQENSAVIKSTYNAIVGFPREVRDGYRAIESTVKHIHDFLNPNHPLGVVGAIERLAAGGAVIGGAIGLGALGVFGPEVQKMLKEGWDGIDKALGDAAKEGREELEKKLKEILGPPPAPDVPLVPYRNPFTNGGPTFNPQLFDPNPPGGKIGDYKFPGRVGSGGSSSTGPAYTPKELNQSKDQWRNKRQGVLGARSPASVRPGGVSATQELMPPPSLSLRTPGGFTGDDVSSGGGGGGRFGLGYLGGLTGDIVPFAKGGIVDRPTIGLLGEAGPEAVVPLSGFNTGFNTGGNKGDVVVGLMRKQTDLLSGILSALTGGGGGGLTRGLGGGLGDGIQLASLSTGGGTGLSGLGGGFPGSGFGAGFPGGNPLKSPPYSLPGGRLPGGGFGPGGPGGGGFGPGGSGGRRSGGGGGRRSGGGGGNPPGSSTGPDTPIDTRPALLSWPASGQVPTPSFGPTFAPTTSAGNIQSGSIGGWRGHRPGMSVQGGGQGRLGTTGGLGMSTPWGPMPGHDLTEPGGGSGTPGISREGMATLDVIASGEAEPQPQKGDPKGYNVGIGGHTFNPNTPVHPLGSAPYKYHSESGPTSGVQMHPHTADPSWPGFGGAAGRSYASGRYQETTVTYYQNVERSQKLHPGVKVDGWSPEAQDIRNWDKAQEIYRTGSKGVAGLTGNLQKDIETYRNNPDKLAQIAGRMSGEWTSLPGGREGARQSGGALSTYAQRFQQALQKAQPVPASEGGVAQAGGPGQTGVKPWPGGTAAAGQPGSTVAAGQSGGTLVVFKGIGGQVDKEAAERIAAQRGQTVQYFDGSPAGAAAAAQYIKAHPGSHGVIGFSQGASGTTLDPYIDALRKNGSPMPNTVDTIGRSSASPVFKQRRSLPGEDIKEHDNGMKVLERKGQAASGQPIAAQPSNDPKVNATYASDMTYLRAHGAREAGEPWSEGNRTGHPGLSPEAAARFRAAGEQYTKETGLEPQFGEMTRSRSAQEQYWAESHHGRDYAVAAPGTSRHEGKHTPSGETIPFSGEAIDIPVEEGYPSADPRFNAWLRTNPKGGARFGLRGIQTRNPDIPHVQTVDDFRGTIPSMSPETAAKIKQDPAAVDQTAPAVSSQVAGPGVGTGAVPSGVTQAAQPHPYMEGGGMRPDGTPDVGPISSATPDLGPTRSLTTTTPAQTERRVSHAHHKGFDDTTDPVTRSLTPTGGDAGSWAPEGKSTVHRPEFTKGTMTPYDRHLDRVLRKDQADRDANDRPSPVEANQPEPEKISGAPASETLKADTRDKPQHTPKHHQRHPSKTSKHVASHTHQPHNVQSHNHGQHHAIHHPAHQGRHIQHAAHHSRHTPSHHSHHPNHHTAHNHPTHHSQHPHHSQPHHVRHPNRGHVPLPRERPHGDLGVGNHPSAASLHEDIGNLHRMASNLSQPSSAARDSGRRASANMHDGTPDVKYNNSDIAAVMASGTNYLS